MKKRICFLALMMSVLMLLSACGAASKSESAMAAPSAPAASAPAMEEPSAPMEFSEEMFDMEYVSQTASGEKGKSVYQDANAKLIRRADLTVQTTEFEQAVAVLEQLVQQKGGYFQSAAVYSGSYRNVNANRNGEYTIRIPAEQYESFMGQTGELGYVRSRNETTENIGEKYYDTEARLKTQKTKQERLLTLLEKAESMEDIISLENALSDVEYEIEQLSSTLNRYDSLVGFSTVYLYLEEVSKVTEAQGVTNTLGERMSTGFSRSVENLVDGFQDFLVWIAYNIFTIAIFAAIAVSAVTVVVRRRNKLRRKKADIPKTEDQ